ncbi:MAG: PD-(D/E)XK nuclease family protein [Bacteroidia bacterium]|nr:PD-(D/E)XK nuclease family protein [Bacteroidia bacterium]
MSFLSKVADFILKTIHEKNLQDFAVIFPSQRSANAFKEIWAATSEKTTKPLPHILTTEKFFLKASGLEQANEWLAWNILSQIVKNHLPEIQDDIHTLDYYIPKMLADFDEINRSLVCPELIFENLHNLKTLENWSLNSEKLSPSQVEYLNLMQALGKIYRDFYDFLKDNRLNYGSFHFRYLAENLTLISESFATCQHFFVSGLNALNACEERVYYDLYAKGKLNFLFDADETLLNDPHQEYGLFLRKHKEKLKKEFRWIENYLGRSEKDIKVIEVAGPAEEAYEGTEFIVTHLSEAAQPNTTSALVVADEKLWPLMLPMLNKYINNINISIEIPVYYLAGFASVQALFEIIYHQQFGTPFNKAADPFLCYKIWLNDHSVRSLLCSEHRVRPPNIENTILYERINEIKNILPPFITRPHGSLVQLLDEIISFLKLPAIAEYKTKTELKLIDMICKWLEEVKHYWNNYPPRWAKEAFFWLIRNLNTLKVPLSSESQKPIQVLGLLESRCLDFDRVMILGVREGILPSGLRTDSFLPIELKRHFKIPVYSDRDAVFAYHFYRLLHSPQTVHLVYEKGRFGENHSLSRFILQMFLEWPGLGLKHRIQGIRKSQVYKLAGKAPIVRPFTEEEMELLKNEFAQKGLSFSSLWDLRNCRLKFFLKKIARFQTPDEVDEMAAPSDFGDILHNVLKKLYSPALKDGVNEILNLHNETIENLLNAAFAEKFGNDFREHGAYSLQRELATKIINRRIKADIHDIQSKTLSKLLMLENEICITEEAGEFNVKFKGIIDRVDCFGDVTRIVDYKTNISAYDKFLFNDWDEKYWHDAYMKKSVQLLFYSLLLKKSNFQSKSLVACIMPLNFHHAEPKYISLKNSVNPSIPEELLSEFEAGTIQFLSHFLRNPVIEQTETGSNCDFCEFRSFCHNK